MPVHKYRSIEAMNEADERRLDEHIRARRQNGSDAPREPR